MDLKSFAIEGVNTAYYIPDFVSEDEEAYLIRKVSTPSSLPYYVTGPGQ